MSIDATRWAWQQPIKANQKIILLSLADRAGENHDCYPSIKRLAQDCGMSRSSLFAHLEELEKMGLIQRINRSSEKGTISNIYRLVGVDDRKIVSIQSPQPPSKVRTTPVQSSDYPRPKFGLPPSKVRTTPVQSSDTEPSINHHINNNNNNAETVLVSDLLLSLNFEEVAPTPNKSLKDDGVLFSLSGLDKKQLAEASKKLQQLSLQQRDIAILTFNQTAELGRIRKPMALINQLVNLGLNNELEPPLNSFNQHSAPNELKTPVEANNEDSRKETLLEILKIKVAKHKSNMLAEFQQRRAVFIQGLGVMYEDDLAAAGLFD